MKVVRVIMFFVAALVLAGSLPAVSVAQDKKKGKKKSGPVVLDEIVIEGRVQKPQAFYILQRSSFGYKIMELEEDYTDKIVNSVKDEIF